MKILIIFLVCVSVMTAYAHKCYVCTNCADAKLLKDAQVMNCPISQGTCLKTTAGDDVSRSCGLSPSAGCIAGVCTCKGDKCNGAGTVRSSIIIGSLISLIVANLFI